MTNDGCYATRLNQTFCCVFLSVFWFLFFIYLFIFAQSNMIPRIPKTNNLHFVVWL